MIIILRVPYWYNNVNIQIVSCFQKITLNKALRRKHLSNGHLQLMTVKTITHQNLRFKTLLFESRTNARQQIGKLIKIARCVLYLHYNFSPYKEANNTKVSFTIEHN